MKDANAAITLLEKWPEKISNPVQSLKIFSGQFFSSVMAAFKSFIFSTILIVHTVIWFFNKYEHVCMTVKSITQVHTIVL